MHIQMHVVSSFKDMPLLKDWAQGAIEIAHRCVNEDGTAFPVLLFLAPHPKNPMLVVQGTLPLMGFLSAENREELHQQKDAMAEIIRQVLEQTRAFAMMMITEAWLRIAPADKTLEETHREVEEAGGIEAFEDRVEVLMVSFETRTDHETHTWPIVRDPNGKPSLAAEMPSAVQVEGRFSSFLHTRPIGMAN